MNMLLTGGTGLIGSVIKTELERQGHGVINLARGKMELFIKGKFDGLGNVDTFIHCARDRKYLESASRENWVGEYIVDVVAAYEISMMLNELCPSLKNIILISSAYGIRPANPKISNSPIHYGVAKAAQIHLAKELAVRLAPKVRANCISYGGVESDRNTEEFKQQYSKNVPLGRMATTNDLFHAVEYILNNDYITGQNLVVDGGMTI